MIDHLSVSQVKLYLLCPLKYWYERASQVFSRQALHERRSPVTPWFCTGGTSRR